MSRKASIEVLVDRDISAGRVSFVYAGNGAADNWVARDLADDQQATGGLGIRQKDQILLRELRISNVEVFSNPFEVAAGTAGNEAIGKRLLEIGRAHV